MQNEANLSAANVLRVDDVLKSPLFSRVIHIEPSFNAPGNHFLLLLSASFLIYGISGILLYYTLTEPIKFVIFFATPGIVYINWKLIDKTWKKIAKSRYYTISSTKNLIGKKGEVVLPVDYRGGIIKIPSHTPMKFERLHVKPMNPESLFGSAEIYREDCCNSICLNTAVNTIAVTSYFSCSPEQS